jgi:hypothetical protein
LNLNLNLNCYKPNILHADVSERRKTECGTEVCYGVCLKAQNLFTIWVGGYLFEREKREKLPFLPTAFIVSEEKV